MTWRADVLTLFPEMFPGPLAHSVAGKALEKGLWALECLDIRDFARDKHRTVDATPAGGGPGMVMRPDVLAAAVDEALAGEPGGRRVVYLSPRGRKFDQDMAREMSLQPGLILLCGRYEGVDQRILDTRGIDEWSIGDYVLSGGEVAALAVLDAIVRLLPGVMGKPDGLTEESFEQGLLEYPHYTKPAVWEGRAIPEVLLSGHHQRIEDWRRAKAEETTKARRPDLWEHYSRAGKD